MTNNKQSSSIDFFWNQLPEILPFTVDTETAVKLFELYEQSKAMHKEEIVKAYNHAYEEGWDSNDWKPVEYYNQTFNNEGLQ